MLLQPSFYINNDINHPPKLKKLREAQHQIIFLCFQMPVYGGHLHEGFVTGVSRYTTSVNHWSFFMRKGSRHALVVVCQFKDPLLFQMALNIISDWNEMFMVLLPRRCWASTISNFVFCISERTL